MMGSTQKDLGRELGRTMGGGATGQALCDSYEEYPERARNVMLQGLFEEQVQQSFQVVAITLGDCSLTVSARCSPTREMIFMGSRLGGHLQDDYHYMAHCLATVAVLVLRIIERGCHLLSDQENMMTKRVL